ncbi:MAG: hypothetical protein HUJ87_15420 [Fusobacterium varium]|uniref:hypothetical protein n=1 Tax=Fusobacterium varium TaxID=856 RepID=UPI002432A385|nr:hypothetical protein [Fusobacterium varium]MCF0171881.1 hypothetical protein [Fusobacterium varium]
MEEKKKKLTLKERRERIKEQLETLNKQIVLKGKKVLANIFYDLVKDEKIYGILEERIQDKEFKEALNIEVKKIILNLIQKKEADEIRNE